MPTAIYFATAADLRAWLSEHGSTAAELYVGFYKRHTGKPSPTWSESVDEALCFGWIDGVRHSVDADRYTNRFTPRRKGSHWSNINIAKVQALIAAKKMTPAGLAAFEARTARKTGRASYEQRPTEFPTRAPEGLHGEQGRVGVVLDAAAGLPAHGHLVVVSAVRPRPRRSGWRP